MNHRQVKHNSIILLLVYLPLFLKKKTTPDSEYEFFNNLLSYAINCFLLDATVNIFIGFINKTPIKQQKQKKCCRIAKHLYECYS